jgi:hypothetical protein
VSPPRIGTIDPSRRVRHPVGPGDAPNEHTENAFLYWLEDQLVELEWRFREFTTRSSLRRSINAARN